jgi:hypothetical protein
LGDVLVTVEKKADGVDNSGVEGNIRRDTCNDDTGEAVMAIKYTCAICAHRMLKGIWLFEKYGYQRMSRRMIQQRRLCSKAVRRSGRCRKRIHTNLRDLDSTLDKEFVRQFLWIVVPLKFWTAELDVKIGKEGGVREGDW